MCLAIDITKSELVYGKTKLLNKSKIKNEYTIDIPFGKIV
jgi:hypothetical protein